MVILLTMFSYISLAVRGCRPGKQVTMTETEVRGLCLKSREIFLSQPILLELEAPLKICGRYTVITNNIWKWDPGCLKPWFLCPAFTEHTVFIVSVRNGMGVHGVPWDLCLAGHMSATHTFLVVHIFKKYHPWYWDFKNHLISDILCEMFNCLIEIWWNSHI